MGGCGLDGMGVRWLGGAPPYVHMQAHAWVVNMIISCKWPPPWGNPWEFHMMSYTHARVCMCMCVHMCGDLTTLHQQPPTPTPQGEPPESVKIQ